MRRLLITVLLASALSALAQQNTSAPGSSTPASQQPNCSNDPKSGLPACEVTKNDGKAAYRDYKQGLKLREKGKLDEAFEYFKQATKLDPTNTEYLSGRELTRQQLVSGALERGNSALIQGRTVVAMAEFRKALELDPNDDFVRQRIRDVLGEIRLPAIQVVKDAPGDGPIRISPDPGSHDFHSRGTTRDLLEQVARAYGMTAVFEDSVVARPARFDVQNVDFTTAINAAMRVSKTFYVPLSARQLLFLADTQQNRQGYERMVTRTYYLPEAGSTQELNELMNVLRIMFDVRFIVQQPGNSTMTIRAPSQTVDAVTQFLDTLGGGRPQVVFEIQVYEISQNLAKQVGVDIPSTFGVFNVPTEARKLLGNQNIQDVINQLVASGLINQGNTTAIAALVAQFLGQNSSPLIGNTLLLFGGGITLTAVPIPPVSVKLNVDESDVRNLESITLRAGHGTPAILKIGQRVPIINASFAPIFNTPALSRVIQNQSFRAPVPSFQFEDLGVNVKATPSIRRDLSVAVDLEMAIRSLSAVSFNGIPVISNREFKGVITVKDGERIVVAGMLSKQEQRTIKGIPGLYHIPVLKQATTLHGTTDQVSELLIVMTPHVVRVPASENRDIPMPIAAGR